MTQKILVTGGAGYVGSTLVPQLLEAGHRVTVLDSLMYNNFQTFLTQVQGYPIISHPNFTGFVKGDIRDAEIVKQLMPKHDMVIHLAAIVGAPACDKHREQAETVNLGGTLNLLKHKQEGQKFIFASTGSNYGKVDTICTEETPLNPLSVYGKTKTEAEKAVMEHNGIAYRFATAFGLAPRLRLDLMVNDFIFQAVKNRHLDVFESDFKRTFIHVRDMAKAFLFGVQNYDNMKGHAFNVGDNKLNYTKREIAEMIKQKVPEMRLWYNEKLGSDPDQRNYEVSYKKIQGIGPGFFTDISMEQGMDELIKTVQHIEIHNPYNNL